MNDDLKYDAFVRYSSERHSPFDGFDRLAIKLKLEFISKQTKLVSNLQGVKIVFVHFRR